MAAPVRITKEAVLDAALALVRERGMDALNARSLARALGCSTQPIFKNFASMEAVRDGVLELAHRRYLDHMQAYMARSPDPSYKAAGMAYVSFARESSRLFRLLFMRNRSDKTKGPEMGDWPVFTSMAAGSTGLRGSEAELFHLEMWAVVHGVAVMLATGYLDLEEETVSRMLTDAYRGITHTWEEGT